MRFAMSWKSDMGKDFLFNLIEDANENETIMFKFLWQNMIVCDPLLTLCCCQTILGREREIAPVTNRIKQ